MDAPPLSLDSHCLDTDNETLTAERQLDRANFAALYEQHLPGLYSYIRARTDRDEDAIDLAHQVFVQALQALPRYRERGIPARAWLYRIARNAVVDFYRRSRSSVSWEDVPEPLHPQEGDEVEAVVMRQERAQRLHQLLRALDDDKREVLALRFAGGLKVREIAVILDRSEAAIKTEIRRSLRQLREHYHDD